MNNSVAGRKVKMLRCHIYPQGIGKKPMNAINPSTFGANAWICDEAQVGVRLVDGSREHVIPWSIIEHVELEPEVVKETKPVEPRPPAGYKGKQLDIESKLKGL